MDQTRTIVISDIHIGIDATTNWYQSSVHAAYLVTVLKDVIARAKEIRELLILGDLFDTWTYLPNERPPTISEIIAFPNNKTVMDLLRKAVDALDGRVSVIPGNHDMVVSQADLALLRGAKTSKCPVLRPETYSPPVGAFPANTVVCTHGHRFSMLCAPDYERSNSIAPLGIGWYVTRAGAYMASQQLGPKIPNVAYLPDQGAPTGLRISAAQYAEILGDLFLHSLGGAITKVIQSESELAWKAPILRHDRSVVNLDTAFYEFAGLLEAWESKRYPNGARYGREGAFEALKLPDVDNKLSWFAQLLAQHYQAAVVIMGHTHVPEQTALVGLQSSDAGSFIYGNSGFNCPSIPDMAKGKHPTYIEIDAPIRASTITVYLKTVRKDGTCLRVIEEPAAEIDLSDRPCVVKPSATWSRSTGSHTPATREKPRRASKSRPKKTSGR